MEFPRLTLFPTIERLEKIGRTVGRFFLQVTHEPQPYQSNHYTPEVPDDPFLTEVKTWEDQHGVEWDG